MAAAGESRGGGAHASRDRGFRSALLAPRGTPGAVVFAHSAARQLRRSRARAARHSPRYRRGPAAQREGRFWGGFVRFPAGCPRLPQDRCARAPAVRMRGGGPRKCCNPQALPKPARGVLGVQGCGVAAFTPPPPPVGIARGDCGGGQRADGVSCAVGLKWRQRFAFLWLENRRVWLIEGLRNRRSCVALGSETEIKTCVFGDLRRGSEGRFWGSERGIKAAGLGAKSRMQFGWFCRQVMKRNLLNAGASQ
ncbi:uncharacterized protein LOC141926765 [Strix aluco]|uniref:uncharacterized protein LOC141926765 n=1 Tax=Strix aluco TaxID=111821 RepID=UPI003DA64566